MPRSNAGYDYEIKFIDGKHYAVFRDGWECEQSEDEFPNCYIACCGNYENAYVLTSDWFHARGRTAAGNSIG